MILSDELQYGFDVLVVDDLPDKGKRDRLYLIKEDCFDGDNLEYLTIVKQYMWSDGWIYLGDTLPEDLEYVEQDETANPSKPRMIRAVNKCPNCGAPLTNGHCSYCECY